MTPPSRLSRLVRGLGHINERIAVGARNVAAVLLALMTAAILAQVYFRYWLNDSLSWSEESAILMMIWVAFLVAPWSYRHGANVAIEVFVDRLPVALSGVLRMLVNVLALWVLYRLLRESWALVAIGLGDEGLKLSGRGWKIRANTLAVPMAWFYFIIPLSLISLMLVGVELLARDWLRLRYGAGAADGGDTRPGGA
jgi:TRAP-type C4-dicarboxylate transport system permease small subunit